MNKLPTKWDVPVLAKLLYLTGAVTFYHAGTHHDTGYGYVDGYFAKWHPVTWLVMIAMVIPCALMGEKLTEVVSTSKPTGSYYNENFRKVTWKEFV